MAVFRDYVIHTPEEIEKIRRAMSMTAEVRDQLVALVRPGMSTLQIDQLAGDLICAVGGKSGFLNYHGFPGNICISLNDEVVHGIGVANRVVQESDIVSLDIGVAYNGAVGDTAVTFGFGELPADTQRLLTATREALMAGIAAARKGNHIRDISRAVEKRAMADQLGIVREMVGHGVGKPYEIQYSLSLKIKPHRHHHLVRFGKAVSFAKAHSALGITLIKIGINAV